MPRQPPGGMSFKEAAALIGARTQTQVRLLNTELNRRPQFNTPEQTQLRLAIMMVLRNWPRVERYQRGEDISVPHPNGKRVSLKPDTRPITMWRARFPSGVHFKTWRGLPPTELELRTIREGGMTLQEMRREEH